MNRYKLLIILLSVPVIIYITWTAIRNRNLRFFLQRSGFAYNNRSVTTKKNIWLHAASVGELNAASPLIKKLCENNNIILTTNTPSSALLAEKLFNSKVVHNYCPVDWQWAIHRFINKTRPQLLLIIETELWPNLFTVCHKKDISITIINGRLSERTTHASDWMKKRYAECLQSVKMVFARSKEDAQRFIELGADNTKVKTTGNIKYYQQHSNKTVSPFKLDRHYVLAASTRDNEEKILVQAWLASDHASRLIVIVPRHPHRLNEIISQLKEFNLNIAIRSKDETITDKTDIYIADTFGELLSFISGADFVIMGGSFVNKGGQNILEVAQLGKTVIFGPYMHNFSEEARLFTEQNAGIQCENGASLEKALCRLFKAPEKIEQYQKNAVALVAQQQCVFNNYLNELENIYPGLVKPV